MKFKYFDINKEGHSIRCKLYYTDARSIKELVVFGHGFGGHKDNKAAERFSDTLLSKRKNSAVLVFNWPAHGDDVKKKLNLDDCTSYLRLVINYAKEELHTEKLYGHATSFGGYLFLKYITENENPFEKIVLRCPAVNMYEVMTNTIINANEQAKLESGKDVLVGFDRKISVTKQFISELKNADITKKDFLDYAEKIMIMHGKEDEIVKFEITEKFCNDNLIEFIPFENADHRFQSPSLMGDAIKQTLMFFFDK